MKDWGSSSDARKLRVIASTDSYSYIRRRVRIYPVRDACRSALGRVQMRNESTPQGTNPIDGLSGLSFANFGRVLHGAEHEPLTCAEGQTPFHRSIATSPTIPEAQRDPCAAASDKPEKPVLCIRV